jgi:hypothetical protein
MLREFIVNERKHKREKEKKYEKAGSIHSGFLFI